MVGVVCMVFLPYRSMWYGFAQVEREITEVRVVETAECSINL